MRGYFFIHFANTRYVLNFILSTTRYMNTAKFLRAALIIALAVLQYGCGSKGSTGDNFNQMANKIARSSMAEDYPKIPQDEILLEMPGSKVYLELQQRYGQQVKELHEATTADHVRLIVLIMSPEVGKFATMANSYGIPYIRQICTNDSVYFEDITDPVAEWSAKAEITQGPIYGNWTEEGAAFAARQIAPIIVKCDSYRSNKTYAASERPSTFGDATMENDGMDNNNDLAKGGQKTPYHLQLNKQGLRMRRELSFPKTRQRIIFLGDSRIFNPFLDDRNTITAILQERFPDKEIVNAGNITCTMDDYVSLYKEKVRFAEPDILIVCTHGSDILDEYFSHRNRFSRVKKSYKPSATEKEFYFKTFGKNTKIIPI